MSMNKQMVVKGIKNSTQIHTETNGILPSQKIRQLIKSGEILSKQEFIEGQIQPASLDLRLGSVAHRVRASFLPSANATVLEKISLHQMHTIDLTSGAVLEWGCVYIVPLLEQLNLSDEISGAANPKSSTGRLDVFTRLITDQTAEFDRVKSGYSGPLYAEISPRTFSILARQGDRLSQLRFRLGHPPTSDEELKELHARDPLLQSKKQIDIAAYPAIFILKIKYSAGER